MMNRRNFLQMMGLAAAGSFRGAHAAVASAPSRDNELEIALSAGPTRVNVFDGAPTRVNAFRGRVLAGDRTALETISGSYLGPTIRAARGQRLRIDFNNELGAESIVHWHGLHVPDTADGHPRFAVPSGGRYTYDFTINNRAGTYWYHPHPHGKTGPQVYSGLAGLLLVSDDAEQALDLPRGEYDIPLVIQDRTFDADNQLVYLGNGMSAQMDRMMGFLGDRILVNGRPNYELPVATRAYRLRLVNGSNSRIYKLAWSNGTPMTVIGTDGGLLERPVQRRYVTLAPAQRLEVWADFSESKPGEEITLRSLPFEGVMSMGGMMGGGMMGGGMMGQSGGSLPNGAAFPVLKVRVVREERSPRSLPDRLSEIEPVDAAAVNRDRPRTFNLTMDRMEWSIDGRTFEMTEVADKEKVRLGTTEIWEFHNDVSGGMGKMAHPIHVHGLQFRILDRQIDRANRAAWETLKNGFVDEGWHDTVLVMPGERVKIALRFEDYAGLYLYHCHNLEHEDMGMMRNYRVLA